MNLTLNSASIVASVAGACPCKAARAGAAERDRAHLAEVEERMKEASGSDGCGGGCGCGGTCGGGSDFAVIGTDDLPVAARDMEWDGAEAARRVFDLYTDDDGNVDTAGVSQAFLWRDPDANPETQGAYSLGFADVVDGALVIVPRGIAATAGGRGVDATDIPEEDKERIKSRICSIYDTVQDVYEDWPDCPFGEDDDTDDDSLAASTAFADGDRVGWRGVIAMENTATGDGRFIEEGALEWDLSDGGIPLRWTREDEGGHFRAVRVGTITDVSRSGHEILAEGTLLTGSVDEADMVLGWLQEGPVGVSVDLDSLTVEWTDGDEAPEAEMRVLGARIRAATLVDIPAFVEAKIYLDSEFEATTVTSDRVSVVASARPADLNPDIPVNPPLEWFQHRPERGAAYRMRVEQNGRVHGYIATWGQCHLGYGDRCVTAPRSASNYREFHRGPVLTDEGTEVLTGQIFFATGHADPRASLRSAARFYEDTGMVAGDVRVGEDEFGIWAAGALRPTVSAAEIREVRAAQPSGDWRSRNGSLELIAALMVNDPGLPVRSLAASAFVEHDEVQSLQITFPGSGDPEVAKKLALLDLDMAMHNLRKKGAR